MLPGSADIADRQDKDDLVLQFDIYFKNAGIVPAFLFCRYFTSLVNAENMGIVSKICCYFYTKNFAVDCKIFDVVSEYNLLIEITEKYKYIVF